VLHIRTEAILNGVHGDDDDDDDDPDDNVGSDDKPDHRLIFRTTVKRSFQSYMWAYIR
jgi:hypothetical protein